MSILLENYALSITHGPLGHALHISYLWLCLSVTHKALGRALQVVYNLWLLLLLLWLLYQALNTTLSNALHGIYILHCHVCIL